MTGRLKDSRPCPIKGCEKGWKTLDGLTAHLFQSHKKADLIKWMLERLNPCEAWRKRGKKFMEKGR